MLEKHHCLKNLGEKLEIDNSVTKNFVSPYGCPSTGGNNNFII
jgi:hypothetical protein